MTETVSVIPPTSMRRSTSSFEDTGRTMPFRREVLEPGGFAIHLIVARKQQVSFVVTCVVSSKVDRDVGVVVLDGE